MLQPYPVNPVAEYTRRFKNSAAPYEACAFLADKYMERCDNNAYVEDGTMRNYTTDQQLRSEWLKDVEKLIADAGGTLWMVYKDCLHDDNMKIGVRKFVERGEQIGMQCVFEGQEHKEPQEYTATNLGLPILLYNDRVAPVPPPADDSEAERLRFTQDRDLQNKAFNKARWESYIIDGGQAIYLENRRKPKKVRDKRSYVGLQRFCPIGFHSRKVPTRKQTPKA